MEWYAILFWIWFAVSVVILVLRRLKVIGSGRDRAEDPEVVAPLARALPERFVAPHPADLAEKLLEFGDRRPASDEGASFGSKVVPKGE